jgi:O-antigen/teichoic acid export membrane protein
VSTAARSRVGGDAVALMVATAGTAALGLLFWVVAARVATPEQVGRAAAQVAALNLAAGIAQLNLMVILLRFLPAAGRASLRVLAGSYGAVVVASVVAGIVLGSPALAVAVAAFAFLLIQDGVLTAFGRARWVPLAKAVVALARFGLLLTLFTGSLVSAWTVPTVAVVLVVTGIVFALAARRTGTPELPAPRALASFYAAEYTSNIANAATIYLPPVLVAALLGAADAAYLNLPWLAVLTVSTLLWNVVSPLIAHSHSTDLRHHLQRTLRVGTIVVAAATVLTFFAGPRLLALQGPGYAEAGAGLTRLLALSIPFTGVVVLCLAVKSIDRDVWRAAAVNAAAAAVFCLATWWLLPAQGLVAVGGAYLATQILTAAWSVVALRRGTGPAAKALKELR